MLLRCGFDGQFRQQNQGLKNSMVRSRVIPENGNSSIISMFDDEGSGTESAFEAKGEIRAGPVPLPTPIETALFWARVKVGLPFECST